MYLTFTFTHLDCNINQFDDLQSEPVMNNLLVTMNQKYFLKIAVGPLVTIIATSKKHNVYVTITQRVYV